MVSTASAGDAAGQASSSLVPMPKAEEIAKFEIHPGKVLLRGVDDAAQLIVTATLKDGRLQDCTPDVQYSVANGKNIKVLPSGRVLPIETGSTEIIASYQGKTVKVPVVASLIDRTCRSTSKSGRPDLHQARLQ